MAKKKRKFPPDIEKLIDYTCKKHKLNKNKMRKELPGYYYWDIKTLRKMTFPYVSYRTGIFGERLDE